MKITKRQLRRIIRESLLQEEMLKIIANPHSPETETFNRIANYAINDDLEGALADTEWVNTPELDIDLDSMGEWVGRVGDPDWMSDDTVVPDNWDADAVWDFMKKLEQAWHNQNRRSGDDEHYNAPNVEEREAIGGVLTRGYVLPKDLPSLTYQVRRRGGQPAVIMIEDENTYTADSMDASWAQQHGTTLDKVIDVLANGGAQLRKKRRSRKYTPPIYD